MTKVWSQQEKYRIWFEIEAYACEAMESISLIPKGTTKNVLKASGIDCLLYTSPSPRDMPRSRMPSSA